MLGSPYRFTTCAAKNCHMVMSQAEMAPIKTFIPGRKRGWICPSCQSHLATVLPNTPGAKRRNYQTRKNHLKGTMQP